MTSREVTKLLRGKTVAQIRLNPWGRTNGGHDAQDVAIHLSDGTILKFEVQETEHGDYGIKMKIYTTFGPILHTTNPLIPVPKPG